VELRFVACKIHQVDPNWTDERKKNYTKHAMREYDIQKKLVHPRVVQLFDVFPIDLNSFCTVLEYCDGSDLDLYLKEKGQLSEREAKCIIMQVFSGLEYLNSGKGKERIIHYDLKPGNILFQQGEVKITDFGLSKVMSEQNLIEVDGIEITSQGAGTYWYLPPECFQTRSQGQIPVINTKVDVWSAGVILYQMLVGKKPFGDGQSAESLVSQGTIAKAFQVEFPQGKLVATETRAFIQRCLSYYPGQRPDILEIMNDPYIRPKGKANQALQESE
jgi:tousled-like kinase